MLAAVDRAPSAASPSASTRSLASARQISPRPWRAMKLIASGVAICAGMMRSPSFSRSSSSTRMNMRPLRASLMIASAPTSTSWHCRASISFSSRPSVSAVGFQSGAPSLRKLLGWRPAARARPERLTSPVAMTALSRSMRFVLMARRLSHRNVMCKRQMLTSAVIVGCHHPLEIAGEDVDFDIELAARPRSSPSVVCCGGVGDEVDREMGRAVAVVARPR